MVRYSPPTLFELAYAKGMEALIERKGNLQIDYLWLQQQLRKKKQKMVLEREERQRKRMAQLARETAENPIVINDSD